MVWRAPYTEWQFDLQKSFFLPLVMLWPWQEKRTRDDAFTPFEGAPGPCKMMSMDDKKQLPLLRGDAPYMEWRAPYKEWTVNTI
jgi:hypothetical protein